LRMGMPNCAPAPLVGTCTPIVHLPDGSPVDGRDASQPRPAAAATRISTPPASAKRARRDSRACLCADPGRDVDGRSDVSAVGLDRLAGVDADADADLLVRSSSLGLGDDREAAPDGTADGVEDDVEAVALGLDLRAAESPDSLPDERAVPGQKLRGGCGTTLLHEGRVAPEVREQEAASDRASVFGRHAGLS
jgi:hypothetical protein